MTTSGNQSSGSASTMRDRAHNMAGRVVDKVQETAGRITGSTQEGQTPQGSQGGQSTPMMEQATEQVTSRVDIGKEYVAGTVTGVAQALRQTGQHLREEGAQPMLATYADRGAEQIERFGGYLRHRETSQLVGDLEQFARRQPMVFAGGAFALGMLAVRFLRSENPSRSQAASSQTGAFSGSSSGGSFSTSTAPMTQRSGTDATPGTSSPPPGGYTAAAQSELDRAPAPQRTSPSGGSAGASPTMNPGTPAAPGVGTGASGTPSERPTPRPAATPSIGGTSSGTGTTPPKPAPGTQTTGGSSTSERTGSGTRNQP
jgi:hypothetical protein